MGDNEDDQVTLNIKNHARPPAPLSLEGNMIENWKRFSKMWKNYVCMSGLDKADRAIQVAQLENCLADDALSLLEGFNFTTAENARTVKEITDAFEAYAIGESSETMERYKFGKRVQQEGETIDKFVADLRIMIKTCEYCQNCESSLLRDRIVLGIRSDTIRNDLLKVQKLTLAECITTCRAGENATSQEETLKRESVN